MLFNSNDILNLIKWHIDRDRNIDTEYLIENMEDLEEYDEASDEDKALWHKFVTISSDTANKYLEAISDTNTVSTRFIAERINLLENILSSDKASLLEQFLIINKLKCIKEMAERYLLFSPIELKTKPGKKIGSYYQQCINCYIEGLYDASAILARSVLQFSFEEILKYKRITYIYDSRKDKYGIIKNLIDLSYNANIISDELKEKAAKVLSIGNKSTHKTQINGSEALLQLEMLKDVLCGLYSPAKP